MLARSSVAQQRQLALRMLCAVLQRSRPCALAARGSEGAAAAVHGVGPDRPRKRPIALPTHVSQELLQLPFKPNLDSTPTPAAPALDWSDVWDHALMRCDITVMLRLSLDDSNLLVVAAAAAGLAALVAPTQVGEEGWGRGVEWMGWGWGVGLEGGVGGWGCC